MSNIQNTNLPHQPMIVKCACGAISDLTVAPYSYSTNGLTVVPYCTECSSTLTPPEDY